MAILVVAGQVDGVAAVLCEERSQPALDLGVLRDLALLAQAELTRVDDPPAGVSPDLAARAAGR